MYFPSDELLSHYAPVKELDSAPGTFLHQAYDLFELWYALERESGTESAVPFWGIAWPAARALCRYIRAHQHIVQGKNILDLGCGCGAVGITARQCGASSVILNDIDPVSLYAAQLNAQINKVDCIYEQKDLSSETIHSNIGVIFIADCFYEKESSLRLYAWLISHTQRGTEVIIADANRPFTPTRNKVLHTTMSFDVSLDVEGVENRNVAIFSLRG
jgi:predicted nicotinamide N-methyase